ncbi:SDR family oxidoreductase [Specibacter sp. NPDC078709]|uniref:SDR family NAD(P)-dependent oxidoreductase n=1 Tax=Specibacter sp. NPDC078709 TaxID=3154364 RepID=UPI003414555A
MTTTATEIKSSLGSLFDLTGRKALIVGAGGGLGLELSKGLAAFGAELICSDRTAELTDAAVAALAADGLASTGVALDMTSSDDIDRLVAAHPDVEVLVITPAVLVRKTLLDHSEADIDFQMDMNIKYTLLLARAFGAKMAERGKGSIITFSSVRASVVEPGSGMYAATKAALVQLMRTLAVELGPQGVRVNLIAPSPVATPLTADVRSKQEWVDIVANRSMLRRWAEPRDFVGPMLLLASDAGAFVTASNVMVDGGWTATDGLARIE